MTTRRHRSSWVVTGVQIFMVVLLAFGLGVAEAWAKERPVRTPSKSAVKAGSSASSRTVTRSTSSPSRTARSTRQITPGSSSRHRARGYKGRHGHYYGSSYVNYHLGFWHWGYYPYSYYWAPFAYPWAYYGYGRPYYRSGELGALDLNVKPKKAEVYLDGDYIGLVKEFDGYPGYLWLERGTYELSFYMPGHQTLTREFRVYPGSVVDVRLQLELGEAVLPEKPERSREPSARRSPQRYGERPYDSDYDRDRYRRQERRESEGDVRERDLRGEPGRLRLSITPDDATVYLDGRLLGSGLELGRLRAGLIVEPGEHLLEVIRPGFESKELEIRVEEGEELELAVQLSREPTPA